MAYSDNKPTTDTFKLRYKKLVQDTKTLITQQDHTLQIFHSPITATLPTNSKQEDMSLSELYAQIKICQKCQLSQERSHAVPGMGVIEPLVMVIGEAPGKDEDEQGLPFVGKSGLYLDKWLAAIQLSRETNVYITNMVKCRPPKNRDPQTHEIQSCAAYLTKQVHIVAPHTILLLGRIAARTINPEGHSLKSLRLQKHEFMGIPTFITYHPSAVLRDSSYRSAVWEDLKYLAKHLEAIRKRS